MEEISNISKAAKILNISPSSMRYWDEEGLLSFDRNAENNYRSFSYHTMFDICDVILYRSLAIPVKEIKEIPSMDLQELATVLKTNERKLENKMRDLEKRLEKLRYKQEVVALVKELKEQSGKLVIRQLDGIRPFSFYNEEMVQSYLERPDRWAAIIHTDEEDDFAECGMYVLSDGDRPLRAKDDRPKQYYQGLFRAEAGNITKNDSHILFAAAKQAGHKVGKILGRYLITAREDQRYDYYEGLVEVLE